MLGTVGCGGGLAWMVATTVGLDNGLLVSKAYVRTRTCYLCPCHDHRVFEGRSHGAPSGSSTAEDVAECVGIVEVGLVAGCVR